MFFSFCKLTCFTLSLFFFSLSSDMNVGGSNKVFVSFCKLTFFFEGKRSSLHPHLDMHPGGRGKFFFLFFLNFSFQSKGCASYLDMDPG